MASDFDGLVGALLNDVALTGRYGFGVNDLERCAKAILDAPPNPDVLLKAWESLSEHMEIESREIDPDEALDFGWTEELQEDLAPLRDQLRGQRLFVSQDRMWDAVAGHPIDLKRLPRLEFDLLSIIAQRGASGLLQPEIVRITGQDKRSVPKRTDLLASKGYIVKQPVLADKGRGVKTSLLKLKKYETDEIEQIVMNYDHWFSESMCIMKSQPNWVVAYQDLRIGLGIEGKKRETRVLARCVRRLANAGCLNRIVVREQINATKIGRPVRCLQLMREPTQDDRIAWETIGLRIARRNLTSTGAESENDDDDVDNDEDDEDEEDEDEDEASQHSEMEDIDEPVEAALLFTTKPRSKSRTAFPNAPEPEPRKRGRGRPPKNSSDETAMPLLRQRRSRQALAKREVIIDFSPSSAPSAAPSAVPLVASATSIAAVAACRVSTPSKRSTVTLQAPAITTPIARSAAQETSTPVTGSVPKKRGRPTKQIIAERERLQELSGQVPEREPAKKKVLLVKLNIDGARLSKFRAGNPGNHIGELTPQPRQNVNDLPLATPSLAIVRPYYGKSTASDGANIDTARSAAHGQAVPEKSPVVSPPTEIEQIDLSEDDAYLPADNEESRQSNLNLDDSSDEEFSSPRKRKSSGYKPRTATLSSGDAANLRYKNLILEILRTHGNVYPGNGELWQPFSKMWNRNHSSVPDRKIIASVVETLVKSGELKTISFSFGNSTKQLQSSQLLTLPSVNPTSDKVKETKEGIIKNWPSKFYPGRHWARDSFVPVDSMVVTRTTKGLSWADKEAQSFGYANAQERKLTLSKKKEGRGRGRGSKQKTLPKPSEATKPVVNVKPKAKKKATPPPAIPAGYDSEDYDSDTSLPQLDSQMMLQSHPQSMDEILDMATRLGHPAADSQKDPQDQFDSDVDRVRQWELAMISGDRFPSSGKKWGFIDYPLNQPHTTPTIEESSWHLRPADGRAKGRKIPSAAQDNTIGLSTSYLPPAKLPNQQSEQQGIKTSPAPSGVNTEGDGSKKFKSRKRKQFDEDDNFSNTEMDPQSGNERPFKRNKRATSSFKDVDRLVTAIALVRCICGGIQMHRMNWDLIAHALSFRYEGNFLRQRWAYFRNIHENNAQRIQAALRVPFLAAYEKGELPRINFQNLAATDMPAIFDWVESTVLPLPEEDPSQLPSLPKNTAVLQKRYQETDSLQYMEQPKDAYHQNVTDMHRRDLALAFIHGDIIPGSLQESNSTTDDLILLKSWCRAVAMTKQRAYKAEVAAKKLGIFPGAKIKRANRELLDDQILSQEKKDRQLPGRNYYLSAAVYKQFKRWPEPEYTYLRKIMNARKRLLAHFQENDTMSLNFHADDSELIVFHNMVAQGSLRTYSAIPERNDDFDAPWPRLTAWGYTDFDYRTKAVDKTRLTFPIVYERTDKFTTNHGLKPVKVPLKPAPVPGEPGLRVPLWADIHGNILDDAWDMVVRSILHLVVFRPGITSESMEKSYKGKLGLWEVEMVMKWMEEVGIAERWATGQEEYDYWKGGWKAGEWWYCTFAPDIATWKAPTV